MADDGGYVIDDSVHTTIDEAWDYAGDFGSKWVFYPYVFIITDSELSIVEGPLNLEYMKGKRVSTVERLFKEHFDKHLKEG